MSTKMELDDLKSALHTLERRLEAHDRLHLEDFAQRRLARTLRILRPLFWGQLAQLAFGVGMIALGVAVWPHHLGVPHLAAAGLVLHAYGLATAMVSGTTLALVSRVGQRGAVLEVQTRLAHLRRFYVRSGLAVGLAWWVLWVPVVIVLFALLGIDIYPRARAWLLGSVGVGVLGIFATWWLHRWSHDAKRPKLARWVDELLVGDRLRRTQAELDELAAFASA